MRFIQRLALLMLVAFPVWADELRIEANNLNQNLTKYVVLDARSVDLYQSLHIDGALNFPAAFTYHNQEIDGKISKPEKMQKYIRALGLTVDTPVVVYDEGSLVDAARLFWALEVYGFKNVKVLSVGFDSWVHNDLAISTDTPETSPSNYVPQINDNRIASKLKTLIATKSPDHMIIDARGDDFYQGIKTSAKRSGHILSAHNYPASSVIFSENEFSELQPIEQLLQVYSDIPKNKKVVTYCTRGKIAAANYLALRELGYDVSVYDASWNEWGNEVQLPINNPSEQK